MLAEKPKYRLTGKAFIAPNLLKEGTIIYYSGEPGPHFEPLNEAAAIRFAEYAKTHPEAMLGHPTNSLPMTMEQPEIVSVPTGRETERALTIEEMADGKAAKPIRTIFDAMERAGEAIPPDPEYGALTPVELSEADKAALAEVERGAAEARAAKAKEVETKQAKGDKPE